MYKRLFKRCIDFIVSFVGLILLLPVFLVLIFLLFFANRGAVFFVQARPGKNEKIFKLIKFKTMSDAKDEQGYLLPDKMRLTKVGRFVRSTSLDELPQLLNVLMGDMSLIGPRPLLIQYLSLYNEDQRRRHDVRPGITGWAQVNGRNSVSWSERFAYDVWYVDHVSLALDVKILKHTVLKVLKREGINSGENQTMPLFKGNNN